MWKSGSETLSNLTRGFQDVLFPPICVSCGGLVEGGGELRHLCVSCVRRIHWVRPPACTTCGHPFFGEMEAGRRCPHCAQLRPSFREGRTAVLFSGPVRALVIELKYHQGLHVLEDMAAILRRAGPVLDFARGATLVPVPLHPRKLRERGYNQSRLIADAIANSAGGGARVEELLVRVRDTPTQTALDRQARAANLKNAFALARGATLNPAHRYILVDDVFTTGSTLNGCSRVLRRAGCRDPDVVTFGHG